MAIFLTSTDASFGAQFAEFVARSRDQDADVGEAVSQIITAVREDGLPAIVRYTEKFDRFTPTDQNLQLQPGDVDRALASLDDDLKTALELAAARITDYHKRQLPDDAHYTDEAGLELGWQWRSVDAAGLYAPGGLAVYPSSVLMNAIPAKVAGVKRLCLCTPTPDGDVNPVIVAAAAIAGVDEIWRIGGAQAVAAMAYGAGPIQPVDVIVGPGNAYVAEAKRQVFGHVGIDSVAGPSEILVVADGDNHPDWIAADLLSQAEHDPSSQSVLITDDEAFAQLVDDAVERQLTGSTREEIARAAWTDNSAIIVVTRLTDAPTLVNALAPEHLELAIADPDAMLSHINHAGSVFLGRFAPEAIGDYLAGPNHVLPTSGAARYASGLSVLNFMKRTSLIKADAASLTRIGEPAARIADAEGLPAHAYSIRIRLGS
ncbi:MAG: histidinol dehydrogenase [Pseudomonadota bacterium]